MSQKIIKLVIWWLFAILYFPVYLTAFLLIKVCAFFAALGYAVLHEPKTAKRILESIFNKRTYGE